MIIITKKIAIPFLFLFLFLGCSYVVNAQNSNNPLVEAVKNNDIKQTEQLITDGADVNIKNNKGWTALHYAAREGYYEIVELLLGSSANPNIQSENGYTPTMLAAYNNNFKICILLIDNGANSQLIDNSGNKAEGFAIAGGYNFIYNYLSGTEDFTLDKINEILNAGDINHAWKLYNAKEYAEAAIEFEKVIPGIELRKGIIDTSYYSKILQQTAVCFELSGNYKKAEEYYLYCTDIYEIIGATEHPNYAIVLNNLAEVYRTMGEYDEALPVCLKALEFTERSIGKDHTSYGVSLNNLAVLYETMGQYQEALPLYLESIEITEKVLGKDHSDYGIRLNNLALLYKTMGQYEIALPLYLEALENTEKTLGKDHLEYGIRLSNLAELYRVMGYYDKALPLSIEAMENTEKALGKDHSSYGIRLNNLALLYSTMGQYQNALPLFLEALENTEKTLGKDHSEYGIRLSNLAELYENMGQYQLALPLYLEAMDNTVNALGKEHSTYAIRLVSLGGLYKNMGQYQLALPLYLEALEVTEKALGKEHPYYSSPLNYLAILYEVMGEYDKALPLYLEAMENTEKALGKKHSVYGIRLNNLAGLYINMGQYQKALPLCIEAMEITENTLGKDHSEYATRLDNLALLYKSMGQYEIALPLYVEALENVVNALGKEHPSYGIQLNNLAGLFETMGLYEEALPLYMEALENTEKSLGKDHSKYAIRLNNLAVLYESMGKFAYAKEVAEDNFQKALPLYFEAMQITEKALGKDHSEYGICLNNLAVLYENMGQSAATPEAMSEYYQKALLISLESLENAKNAYGKNHSSYGIRLNNLAGLYESIGQSATTNEGAVENYEKALQLYIEGVEVINNNINQNFAFLSEKEKEAYLKTVSYMFPVFNSFAIQNKSRFSSITTHVFDNAVTNKGILLKSTTAMRSTILGSGDTALVNKFDSWTLLNKQIASLYSTEISKRNMDPKELEEQATIIERQLVQSSQEFSEFMNEQNIKWQDVQNSLKPNDVAIEFISFDYYNEKWTDTTYYCVLLIVPDSQYPEMIPLFTENEYENSINSTNNSSDAGLIAQLYGKKRGAYSLTSNNTYTNYADSLYSLIWSKIDPYLEGVETVYYSPSGLLHSISFAAIPYNDSLLLSDKYELVYVASTGNIVNRKPQKDINEFNVVIYGGLNYDTDTIAMLAVANNYNNDNLLASRSITVSDSTRGGTWNYLQGTLDEAESIESMFENNNINTTLYTAKNGVEESFKSLSGRDSPEVIHLATHGFFFPDPEKEKSDDRMMSLQDKKVFKDSDNPLIRSGLIMSGANLAWNGEAIPEGIDDGILTAYEVSGLDLYNTELVVLSARETGLGDIKGSEGVYGLQRSFKMAGVDYLVMSLWQVPDNETSEFMQLFYQNLLAKQSVGIAFRNAQKVMKEKYDPYYWAAFVLIE